MDTHGLLLLDKPEDLTSHDVVARVRRILRQKTVGHTGTLDPLATGLMVLVLGDATKLSDYLIAEDKSYRVRVRFGVKTDTLDRTGQVLAERSCDGLNAAQIKDAVDELQGTFEWPVPLFSAAKVGGKKLCDYGRAGEEVEVPTKIMKFWDAKVLATGPDWVDAEIFCSKGSFVRTWADRLGELLGVGGVVESLRRLTVGSWRVDKALTLEGLEEAAATSHLGGEFVPMGQALPNLKAVMAGPKEIRLVGHGQIPRDIENRLIYEQKQAFDEKKSVFVKVVTSTGDLLAILAAEPGQGLKIRRVFRSLS